ncbi:hypothetical protein N0V83_004477 [Neocucurbitaria cava]|uniref:Uncharacterized protein n=1 Tax=Neocucurbitaria cava TaxID=798079 RepID=A0A9W8YC08_9PLEO|nr:hypothetical protein N0V83_004477 [Neocucurbitaria cava]
MSQQRKLSTSAKGSPMAGNKRKIKTEVSLDFETAASILRSLVTDSPIKGPSRTRRPSRSKAAKTSVSADEMIPPHAIQTAEEETTHEEQDLEAAASHQAHVQVQAQPFTPAHTPQPDTHPAQPHNALSNAQAMSSELLTHTLRLNPGLLPKDPATDAITSKHIDDITHAMWQLAFNHDALLQQASSYGAMFSHLKLSALAKLNFLPSWWFLREMIVKLLKGKEVSGWVVDDSVMDVTWRDACHLCRALMVKRGMNFGVGQGNGGDARGE